MRTIASLLSALYAKYKALGGTVILRDGYIIVDRAIFRDCPPKNIRNRWQVLDPFEGVYGVVRSYGKAISLIDFGGFTHAAFMATIPA